MTSTTTDDRPRSREIGATAKHWIEEILLGSPVAETSGVELVDAEYDRIHLRLPFADRLVTVPGVLHGGVIATVIDIAAAAALATGIRDDDGVTGGATSHLNIAYLRPATGTVDVVATVVHRTRSLTQSDVAVRGTDGTLVATGQATSRLFH